GSPNGCIGRKRRLAPRNQWRRGGLVIRRDAHNAVGSPTRIPAVDLFCRNIAVPPQIAWITGAALAILNRILVAVDLERVARGICIRRQSPVRSSHAPQSRVLPAPDPTWQDSLRIAEPFFAPPSRDVQKEIPANLMFQAIGPASIIQD